LSILHYSSVRLPFHICTKNKKPYRSRFQGTKRRVSPWHGNAKKHRSVSISLLIKVSYSFVILCSKIIPSFASVISKVSKSGHFTRVSRIFNIASDLTSNFGRILNNTKNRRNKDLPFRDGERSFARLISNKYKART